MAHLEWEQRKERSLLFWAPMSCFLSMFSSRIKLGERILRAEERWKSITSLKLLAFLWKHLRSIKHGGIHHQNGNKKIISFHTTHPYSFLFRGQWRSWHWPPLATEVVTLTCGVHLAALPLPSASFTCHPGRTSTQPLATTHRVQKGP